MAGDRSRLVVLSSIVRNPDENPFAEWLMSSLGDGIDARWFRWRTALVGRYDLFHVHWPEYLFGSPNSAKAIAKSLLGFALLARLFILRTPVIQTVHTQNPYDDVAWVVKLQSRLLSRRTVFHIFLNESPENDVTDGAVILLGRYPARPSKGAPTPGRTRLLTFGLLRAYKGIEDLLSAFRGLDGDALELAIIGDPTEAAYAASLARLAELDPRVELTPQRVDDDRLAFEVASADLVVLPYTTMYNSSTLLYALDHRVPVLATRSPSTIPLQDEIGDAWLFLFDGTLTTDSLSAAIESLDHRGDARHPPPDLRRRDWATIGRLHASLFRFAVATPRRRRNPREWRRWLRRCVESDPEFGAHSALNRSADGRQE